MKQALAILLLLGGAPAFAMSTDDVQKLAQGGVADEVILAQIRAEKASFELTAEHILALKKNGVSDAVLKAMIETRTETRTPAPDPPTSGEATQKDKAMGRLLLANDSGEPTCVMVSPEARSIFFYYGRLQDRVVLEPGGSRTLDVPPGAYTVRWVGERARFSAPVTAGGTTRVVATRIETADYAGLHVSIFEGEQEADAGMLKVFRDAPRPEPPSAMVLVPAPMVYAPAHPAPPPGGAPPPPPRGAPFIGPWTVLGAGLGAVIGHQSDSRDKGAALGAVFGHFLDHANH
jgi:hypothetical protein